MDSTAIFSYETPAGTFYADPVEVIRKVRKATNNQIDELFEKASYLSAIDAPKTIVDENGAEVRNPFRREYDHNEEECRRLLHEANIATDQVLDAFRYAFNLKRFDPRTGEGATESFVIDLVEKFREFVKLVKKNTP